MHENHKNIAATGAWAVEQLAESIGSSAEEHFSTRWGTGKEMSVPITNGENSIHHSVQTYEGIGVVVFNSPHVEITLFDVVPHMNELGIEIDSEDASLQGFFHDDGHFLVEVDPKRNE